MIYFHQIDAKTGEEMESGSTSGEVANGTQSDGFSITAFTHVSPEEAREMALSEWRKKK